MRKQAEVRNILQLWKPSVLMDRLVQVLVDFQEVFIEGLKKGSREVGKEAVRAGLNIVNDFASNKKPLKDAITQRIKESDLKLKRKAEEKLDKLMGNNKYKMLKSSHEAHLDIDSDTERLGNDDKLKVKKIQTIKEENAKSTKEQKKKKNSQNNLRPIADIFRS